MPNSALLHQLFYGEPAGRFALGHIFRSAQGFSAIAKGLGRDEAGQWSCDLTDRDRLAWSDKVYELFGFPDGAPVERDAAVARYTDHSKSVLERVRTFAILRKCGFILDAAIRPEGQANRWIRVIAFPVVDGERVVALQGLKRAL